MTKPVIMWFRQDLRLSDHPALTAAAAAGPVIPLYVLDDDTPAEWAWGGASKWWLHRSLTSLAQSVPLVFRRGKADVVLAEVMEQTGAAGIYFTRDYAPWSGALEARVKAACESHGAQCHRYGGFLLYEPDSIRNKSGAYFKVYTPFSRACMAEGDPRAPKPLPQPDYWRGAVSSETLAEWNLLPVSPNWARSFETVWQPGEAGAERRLLHFLDHNLIHYADGRDRPDMPFTSQLSPHLHWGEISPQRVWQATRLAMAAAGGKLDRSGEKFLREILWREFSYHLIHHFPTLPHDPFRSEFAEFPWVDDVKGLRSWQRGETGFPIVDAGMRELWATGIMHNRVRMIVASFLVKDLLVPWQAGQKWFWDTLVDADIGNNAASWQWVAGCGADAAPYFRVFNPVLQGEKFDPEGTYVRRWIPELAAVPNPIIHRPWEASTQPIGYPPPIVDHAYARDRALAAFKQIRVSGTV